MKRKTARRITVIILSLIFSIYSIPLSAYASTYGDFNVEGGAARTVASTMTNVC